jgi:hypothetical protein
MRAGFRGNFWFRGKFTVDSLVVTTANGGLSAPTLTSTILEVARDDDEYDSRFLVYRANEILKVGLHLVGYKER